MLAGEQEPRAEQNVQGIRDGHRNEQVIELIDEREDMSGAIHRVPGIERAYHQSWNLKFQKAISSVKNT